MHVANKAQFSMVCSCLSRTLERHLGKAWRQLPCKCHAPLPSHATADLETSGEKLASELEQSRTQHKDAEGQLADSRAQAEQLAKELSEAQEAAAAAAEEAKATIERLEQQLAEAQEAQVSRQCGDLSEG